MSSQSSDRKSGRFVLPGERLGVIEEFIPNMGTYVRDGIIYSRIVGRALLDLLNKRVSVYPLVHRVKIPKNGRIVLGQVSNVQTQNAVMRIFRINKKQFSGFFTGILHVSNVRTRYVGSMFNVCKPGDIVRAKVISEKNGAYHLSTEDRNLGVVYGFCSRCGHMLELKRKEMRCPRCGKIEKRKTVRDYGEVAI